MDGDVVIEGRDIGTVVFPEADLVAAGASSGVALPLIPVLAECREAFADPEPARPGRPSALRQVEVSFGSVRSPKPRSWTS